MMAPPCRVAVLLLAMMSGLWLVVSAAPTPEQLLVAAILNPLVTKYTLRSDVLLTASLPDLTSDFAVVGKCPRGRRCVIDGQNKHRAFWTNDFVISLTGLHLKNLVSAEGEPLAANRSFGVGAGAAAYAYDGAITATNCVFENNLAVVGGAIGVRDARFTAKNCLFLNNKAGTKGGAIKVSSNGGASVSNSHFVGNTAGESGGAVHGNEGGLRFSRCKFEGNKANGPEGGGAMFFNYIGGNVWASEFTGNSAPNGGGGAAGVFDPTLSEINFCGCTFEGNSAKTSGSQNLDIVPTEFGGNLEDVNFCKSIPPGVRAVPPARAVENCTVCSSPPSFP